MEQTKTYVVENCKNNSVVAQAFADLTWVIQARSKDKARVGIQGFLKEGRRIVATDGYRMHFADLPEELPAEFLPIEDGFYNIVTANKKQIVLKMNNDVTFPDYKAVLPEKKMEKVVKVNMPKGSELTNLCQAVYPLNPEGQTMDVQFLGDLAITGETWDVEYRGNGAAFVFKNSNKTALVMPKRM